MAETYLREAVDASDRAGSELLKGRALYGIGKLAAANERFNEALDIHREALKYLGRTGALSDQAKVLTSMGMLHSSLGEHERAVACQNEAYALASRAGDVVTEAYALANGVSSLISMKLYDESEDRIVRAKEVFSKTDDRMMLSLLALLEGEISASRGEWDSAQESFERCLETARASGLDYYLANWYTNIGEIYERHGRKSEAEESFAHAITLCEHKSLDALREYVKKKLKKYDEGGS